MDKKMSANTISVRAQAFVLVALMVVAGSIASTPAILAGDIGSGDVTHGVSENLGGIILVEASQSVILPTCYAGSNVPILMINITDLSGTGDNMAGLTVLYSGDDTSDIIGGALWLDDGDGIYSPTFDAPLGPATYLAPLFTWGPVVPPIPPLGTISMFMTTQTSNFATVGNDLDVLINPGGMIFTTAGPNTMILDPTDGPDVCTVVSNILPPQAIYGYVVGDDLTTPIAGVQVTVTEGVTGEPLNTITDANGRYDVDLNDLLFGFTDGDLIEVTTLAPNQAYNSANLDTGLPAQNIMLFVDTTAPTSVLSIVPLYNNTGQWDIDFTWDDALVNGYASGVYAVDIYVETPATPGVFNYWAGEMDPWITGTLTYIPSDGDGVYHFYSLATDYAGNNESAVKPLAAEDSINYDTTDPTSTVTGPLTSDSQTLDVTYNFNDPGATPSGVANVSLWYSDDGGTTWVYWGDDSMTGTFTGVTVPADGTYSWYTAAWDVAGNYETFPPTDASFIEYATLVDTVDPAIGPTTVDKLYINNQGTFGGTAPPVQITTSVTDLNLGVAAWGIRNDLQIGNATMYFTCNFTADPSTYEWDGSWYFINGVLVTAAIAPELSSDIIVYGEVNGASAPEDIIGAVLPSHYATFDGTGAFQGIYDTLGTLDYFDDVAVPGIAGDTFRAYRYDEGPGYIATASVSTHPGIGDWATLTIAPIVDGRYAVCVSAIDFAQNSAWTNETTGNPVITVDNYAPDADATGPLTSDVQTFDVTYNWVADPLPSSGVVNVTLWYNRDGGGWNLYGDDPTPGDGLFPVDVSGLGGDGTYEWYMISYDNTDNHEAFVLAPEYATLVDTVAPAIGVTTVDKLYINNQGTFGGTAPPVQITTSATDTNLAVAAWGIRNDLQIGNSTLYFTCNFTASPSTYDWDGSWYFIDGVLVTAAIAPEISTDLIVYGEVNGASSPEDIIGAVLPDHYATFDGTGAFQGVYDTLGTLDYTDDVLVPGIAGDTFRAYRYDEGPGYIATASVSTHPGIGDWATLTIAPIVDGRYAVCVSAIDAAGNTAWTNETTGNPVITVDNHAPDADATGPSLIDVYIFDVNYTFIEPVPSSGLINVTLWYNLNGTGWTYYGEDPTPGDGFFPVDLSGLGDGIYDWFMAGWDMTQNHEDLLFTVEATTLIDNIDPSIGATTVNKLYINNQGTYGGTPPPVQITTSVTDSNLVVASWGIRNDLQIGNATMYFTCNFTASPSMYDWDGSWYFINGVLVTASIAPEISTDLIVYGEINGASAPEDVIGIILPDYYATFDGTGAFQGVYDTLGTIDYTDDLLVPGIGGDTFRAYRYDEGDGYVATASVSTHPGIGDWATLTIAPIVDGRYAVCVSAIDAAENTAWTNETTGNPVVTVDTVQPLITTEMILSTDFNGNGYINVGDIITIWVNVTDLNEDGTIPPNIDVDEYGLPDQGMLTGPNYLGGGVWESTYQIMGPEYTVSNIDSSFGDLADNWIYTNDMISFDIYGSFNLNYAAGWNLFSIPVLDPKVGASSLTSAYDITAAGATMVSKWDFAGQRYINFIAGFHLQGEPQDFALMPDEAYWAWMPAAGTLTIDGLNPGLRNVVVQGPGWNLIGYTNPAAIGDVDTDWAPFVACGLYDDIAYYDAGTFYHYIFPGTVMSLEPGRGYFVWSDVPTNLPYSGMPPGPIQNANNGDTYWFIQDAIDAATPGDTVIVGPGIYSENIVIDKPLTLQGAGAGINSLHGMNELKIVEPTTILGVPETTPIELAPSWDGNVVTITSDDVSLTGFELSNSGSGTTNAALYMYFVQNCEINDIKVTNSQNGFYLDNSMSNTIMLSRSDANEMGIYLTGSSGNTIYHNDFTMNNDQAFDDGINDWNLPMPDGGNYWEDLTSPDVNGNGVVDVPYTINGASNQDNFPWTSSKGWGSYVLPELASIVISPDPVEFDYLFNGTVALSAQGYDQYGDTISCSPTWSDDLDESTFSDEVPGNPATVNLNADGTQVIGTYEIEAQDGLVTGTATLEVTPVIPIHNTDTGEGFSTIQEAIDDSDTLAGHTITVAAGIYLENIVINKALTIQGEDPLTTIIDASSSGSPVTISVNGVTINGFSIKSSALAPGNAGIYMNSVQNCLIQNNRIFSNYDGIYMTGSSNNEISSNWIYSNSMMGAQLRTSNLNTIDSNTMNSNARAVYLWTSNNNIISGNSMTSNTWHIYIETTSTGNSILSNTITGGSRGMYFNQAPGNFIIGNTVSSASAYGIHLYYCSGTANQIYNNNFIGNAMNAYRQSGGTQTWSLAPPIGGNYWSDYAGVDANTDGFGDTAHNIDGGTDFYPLMNPFP